MPEADPTRRGVPGWLMTAGSFVVYVVGVLAVMSAVVSLTGVPPGSDPARFADAPGGPTWWGYQALHAGPGFVVLVVGILVAARRRRRRQPTPFTDFQKPL